MNKYIIGIVALIVVVAAVAGLWFWLAPKPADLVNLPPADIEIFNPKPNAVIASPLAISGIVRGNGWSGFEGQVGTVRLLDAAGKELAATYLPATGDWMTLPVPFATSLTFASDQAQEGKLVFRNENASGDAVRDKTFVVPVKIPVTNTMAVFVYFTDPAQQNLAPKYDCGAVWGATRFVPKTAAPARAALEELLRGPTDQEKVLYPTSINSGVVIQKLTIENGVAKVDFNNQLQNGVGGSCKVTAIRAQITRTLQQFSTVKSVVISINGKTEDILQP